MGLFSRKKKHESSKVGKKMLLVTGCMLALFMAAPVMNNQALNTMTGTIEAQAAETQSSRWVGGDNIWKVQAADGVGYIGGCWFQDDVTGYWYLIDDYGFMNAGLVTDSSTGKTYLLNPNHDGSYGRMITANGTYSINGSSVYLEFNQSHDGSYGAITTGLSEVRATGVIEVKKDSIPTENNDIGDNTNHQTNTNSGGSGLDDIFDDHKPYNGAGGSTSGDLASFTGQSS